MQEQITLTILNSESLSSHKFEDECDKFWDIFDTRATSPFDTHEEPVENKTEEKLSLGERAKLRRLKKRKVPPVDTVKTSSNWSSYHGDLLKLSRDVDVAFQLDTLHPQTEKQFRIFYSNGKSRICETPDEIFDKSKLI